MPLRRKVVFQLHSRNATDSMPGHLVSAPPFHHLLMLPSAISPVFRSVLVLLALLFAAPRPAALDVARVSAHLDRAESNLELVRSSIGHLQSPPKGSAAKLAKLRLEQAWSDLDPARKLLEGAADGPGVPEARARLQRDLELFEALRGILEGKPPAPKPEPSPEPSPKPSPEPSPEPGPKDGPDADKEAPPKVETPAAKASDAAPKTVKLGYPHADAFKNSLFTLRRVEGEAAGYKALAEELRPVSDQLSISHRRTAGALQALTETRRQGGFVRDGLAKLPQNGEGVAEAKERLAVALAELDAVDAYVRPLHGKLMECIDPAGYPDFEADCKRLTDLSFAYANPEMAFLQERSRAAEAFAQAAAAKEECGRIARTYARLIQQETDMGKRIEGAGNGFLRNQQAFLAMAQEQRGLLPTQIRADVQEIERMASDAVANQKPLWFTGGIPQQLAFAEDKLALLEALDPAAGAEQRARFVQLQASLTERAASLRELIVRENVPPEDRFAGADREAAIAIAKDAWNHQEPGFELLAVRIPAEAWSRETKWTYHNGTWTFSDRSSLQVRLFVADPQDPELAMDRPINVRKDHLKGDTLIGVPMRSFDEELQPSEYLLRAKL